MSGGFPSISSQGLAFVRQIMRQISPPYCCYIADPPFHSTSGNTSQGRVDFAQMFLIGRVERRQEKLLESKTNKASIFSRAAPHFRKADLIFCFLLQSVSLCSFLVPWNVGQWLIGGSWCPLSFSRLQLNPCVGLASPLLGAVLPHKT